MISLPRLFFRRERVVYSISGALGALLLLVALGTPSVAFAARHPLAKPSQPLCVRGACFIQTTTASNTHGNYTILDHVYPNNSPTAVVLASPVLDLSNFWPPFSFDSARIGVEYDFHLQRWLIVNEDGSLMPLGARFNVQAYGQAPQEGTFSMPTDSTNLINNGSQVRIDDPLSNNNPHALIFVTNQIYQPNPSRDSHPLGTKYDSTTGKWVLFHEDGTSIRPSDIYDLLIAANQSQYAQTVSTNTYGVIACVNAGSFNDPAATPLVSVTGTTSVADPIGLLYDPLNSEWCVFDMAIAPLPSTAQFTISNL